jgi:hypothetical protein
MIRPITCLAFLLACGSGLYLYQSKHRVKLLDEQIAQTVKSTDALREQTRMLSAEWTLLNDPERLRQLATQFLTLQTVSPNQFTSLADLDSRLPAPVPPGPPADAVVATSSGPELVPVPANPASRAGEDEGKPGDSRLAGASAAAANSGAVPAQAAVQPPSRIASAAAPDQHATDQHATDQHATDQHAADQRGLDQHALEQRVAEQHPGDAQHPAEHKPSAVHLVSASPRFVAIPPRPPEQRAAEQRQDQRSAEQRLAEARPVAAPPRFVAPAPMQAGSLLGMAHGMASQPVPLPLPRPMPVSVPQWSYNNGG